MRIDESASCRQAQNGTSRPLARVMNASSTPLVCAPACGGTVFSRAILTAALLSVTSAGFARAAAAERDSPRTRSAGAAGLAEKSNRASLIVTVENLSNAKGKVCVALFTRAEGFPSDLKAASKKSCVDAEGGNARVSFEGLDPGTYAVSAIHDENDDGKFNTGAFGIPKEGFGFSNNPPVRMGAPGFGECTFPVSGSTSASVRMHQL